jgi:hypothetical protein
MSRSRSAFIGVLSLIAAFPGRAGSHFQPVPSGVAAGASWTAHADDSSGVVTGVMSDSDADHPVPYGTVAIVGTERAVFADAEGRFRLGGLASGTYIVRARQIGYAPKDTTVQVGAAPLVTVVTFHMHRIPALLKVVRVEGRRSGRCVVTGIPDSTADLPLARIFTQVRENVDRFRLLADAYPYRYRRVETNVLRSDPGGDSTTSTDTISYESRAKRPYRLGGVIYDGLDDAGHHREYMYLPTFRDLADSSFLALHCFNYGGTESVGGSRVLRIDFRPADTIARPDVKGSIYLDSARLIVRRAVFRMTKPEAANTPILGLTVTATYREVAPLIPVVDSVITDQPMPSLSQTFSHELRRRTAIEEAYLLDYAFEPRASDGAPLGVVPPARDTDASRGVLAGRVLQSDGIPVGHAVVELLGTKDSTQTSSDGHFVLRTTTPGTYMVGVRALGLRPERFVATLAQRPVRDLVISMDRSVPVLATVTTTSDPKLGQQVGFDKRKAMGIGQFLTYDQIQSKHATAFTQLLQSLAGISLMASSMQPGGATNGSRGPGSCVSYFVDGIPQLQLMEHTVDNGPIGGETPDNLIDVSQVGAIEVYSSAERPAEFQGMQEHPMLPGAPVPKVGLDRQQCALVVVWTRGRLGVSAASNAPARSAVSGDATRVEAVFGQDSACATPPAPSMMGLTIYATLQGAPLRPVSGDVWAEYTGHVLHAVQRAAVLPTELRLPIFDVVDTKRATAGDVLYHAHQLRDVAPVLSSVISFTLDSAGALVESHVAASSLSGAADTSILVMLAQASATHEFPPVPPSATGGGSAQFDLVVSSGEIAPATDAAAMGHVAVPVWRLSRAARLAPAPRRGNAANARAGTSGPDSVTIEGVVDANGRIDMTTARVIRRSAPPTDVVRSTPSPASDTGEAGFGQRVGETLSSLRFEPAQIAGCSIAQLVVQPIAIPRAPR